MTKQRLNIVAVFGQPRRRDRVRVIVCTVRGIPLVRVQWKEGAQRKTQSFPNTRKGLAEAKAYASGMSERLAAKVMAAEIPAITVRELFERYVTAGCDAWRPRTLQLKKERWQKFEIFVGRSTPAHLVTQEHLDEFKRAMVQNRHAINQVALSIANVTAVFRWGVERDLIPPTKVATYTPKFGRDARRRKLEMAEYKPEEREKILKQLDPRSQLTWRAWVLTELFSFCGPRQLAARHLEWDDVVLEPPAFTGSGEPVLEGTIKWRADTDKMANERVQPLPAPVAEALWVALGWRMEAGYTGRYVFFGARRATIESDRPYTHQAYAYALHEAERKAGVPHLKYRASHGFRRGIAKDVYDATGSEHKAAEWLGDRSVRVVKESYLKERAESQRDLARLVSKRRESKVPPAGEEE